jgi:hypothetical protein
METKESGWNWTKWNGSEKMLVSGLIATVLTLFLAWRDAVLIQVSGFESGEAWVALGLVAYPAINVLRGRDVNKILAIILTVLAVLWGLVNLASGYETIEADGFFVEEDTILDFNGIGAYLFVPISVVSMIGALRYQPSKLNKHSVSPPQSPTVPLIQGPDVSLVGTVDGNGYEWIVHEGVNYWRLAGSGSGWTRHQ